MKYTITETAVGSGKNYRKVYHVHNEKGIFLGQYSNLESAVKAYPRATIDLLDK